MSVWRHQRRESDCATCHISSFTAEVRMYLKSCGSFRFSGNWVKCVAALTWGRTEYRFHFVHLDSVFLFTTYIQFLGPYSFSERQMRGRLSYSGHPEHQRESCEASPWSRVSSFLWSLLLCRYSHCTMSTQETSSCVTETSRPPKNTSNSY